MAKKRAQYHLVNHEAVNASPQFEAALQDALLLTLLEQKLLTLPQYEKCIDELKRQKRLDFPRNQSIR